jgi:LacI family transcriptional regulator
MIGASMVKRDISSSDLTARPVARPLRIAIRLRDWSEWCRQIVRGVQEFAHAHPDWQLYVDTLPAGTSRVQRGAREWDGIITSILENVPVWQRMLRANRTKVVAITAGVPAALQEMPRVRVDDARVAQAACKHLLTGGFRQLAYYASQAREGASDPRLQSVQMFAEAEGYPFDVHMGDYHKSAAYNLRRLTRWVARLSKPVGILTWNMDYACQVVDACRRAGAAVPDQVAVVAWDDDVMLAETAEPTVSGSVLPVHRLGYEAARLLNGLMRGEPIPKVPIVIEPSGVIHIRQSSDVSSLPDRDVHLAVQYIREHAIETFKVPNLAKALGISRRKLDQDFTRVVGHTPNEAILRARLERAKRLLLETGWPLTRVAERSGFGTVRRFHQVFAQREGMTPAAYRKRFAAP